MTKETKNFLSNIQWIAEKLLNAKDETEIKRKETKIFLSNLQWAAEKLLNAKDETEIKRIVGMCWEWLAIRAIAGKDNPINEVLPVILEAIEQDYKWGIPTMDEIRKESQSNTNPPDEDDR